MVHESEDEIICPYCNYVFDDSWDYDIESGEEIECRDCEKAFEASSYTSISYSSRRIDCKDDGHDFMDPFSRTIDQGQCDCWNGRNFCGRSDWKPHIVTTYECKNCDDIKREEVNL